MFIIHTTPISCCNSCKPACQNIQYELYNKKQLSWLSNDANWLKTDYWNQPISIRFLHAALTWDSKEDNENFRLMILSDMMQIISDFIMTTTQNILDNTGEDTFRNSLRGYLANEKFHEIVNNELSRLVIFTELLAKNALIKKGTSNRPVLF